MNTTFGIIGGDKRQLYLARSIIEDGYGVYVCGFEMSGDTSGLFELSLSGLISKCDNIILPLPSTRDGVNIFAPYSSSDIPVTDSFVSSLGGKNVYGGYMSRLMVRSDLWSRVNAGDYYLQEELAVSNAVPTAEGAIGIAVNEYPGTINGTRCLITGFGRIGKILAKDLLGLGATVHVAARKNKDLAMIRAMGAVPLRYNEIKKDYKLIFNTVPDIVITPQILSHQGSDSIIIELASSPGGVDKKAAAIREIKIIDGQSLPGKVAPMAAAEYIKEAIYNMMEE